MKEEEKNLCPRCRKAAMSYGFALKQTWVSGLPDFPGDSSMIGQTMVVGGPGKLVTCLKCPECGHSILPGRKEPNQSPEWSPKTSFAPGSFWRL